MENKAHALAAGAFVLLMAGLLLALALWLTHESADVREYEISTREPVSGLQQQAAVRFRGVKVGKVAALGFDPQQPGQVLIRIEVDAAAPLTRSTYATLGYQGLTGIAYVQLDDSGESREPLRAAGAGVPRIPMRAGLVEQWSRQGERLIGQLEQATQRLNALLAEDNQRALRRGIDALGTAAAAVPPALQQTRQSFAALRQAADEVRASAAQVRSAAAGYEQLAQRLQQPGGALQALQLSAETLAATAQSLQQASLPRLHRTLEEAARAAQRIGQLAERLGQTPQSLIYGAPVLPPGPGEPGFIAPPVQP
jgi:phospholipid/cholesterol/gamma-HCH transport system substrate-binding protein